METKDKNEVLVKVQNVSKKFCTDLKTSLKYGAIDIARSTLGLKTNKELRDKEFWAVNDVSFELRRGECIGLIGHNGAGKSTLLKVLNGLYAPDKGQITMKGKIGALIELGAGFQPILTGRENIYNNAAILGFTREEVDAKMDDIIAFSEIEEFLDTPVKNYSSGMKVRLGFAVAVHMEPDILIIDEVLAVGDLGFVLKCFKKIDELLPHTAIIFVSHSMPMVSRMCSEIILLDHGKVQYQGDDVAKGIDLYYNRFNNNDFNIIFDDNKIELIEITTNNQFGEETNSFQWRDDLIVELKIRNKTLEKLPAVALQIFDKEQRGVADFKVTKLDKELKSEEIFVIRFKHKELQLSKGKYTLNILASKDIGSLPILRINNAIEFFVRHEKEVWAPFMLDSEVTIVE